MSTVLPSSLSKKATMKPRRMFQRGKGKPAKKMTYQERSKMATDLVSKDMAGSR